MDLVIATLRPSTEKASAYAQPNGVAGVLLSSPPVNAIYGKVARELEARVETDLTQTIRKHILDTEGGQP